MLLQKRLREWREEQAKREGIESYKILSKATLDLLVSARPKNKEELLLIKGIKEKKFQKYGRSLLEIIAESSEDTQPVVQNGVVAEEMIASQDVEPLTVSQFLDGLNVELSGMAARIQGEVTSVDIRERVVYFTVKDMIDGSTLPCLIFRFAYQISGVDIKIGDEIIVEGAPEIYKPNGRLSLKVGLIELAGEGMLKKAYDELHLKLEQEGLLALEKKRKIPDYPERIALITSSQGAAIDDFKMNLGNFGFKVDFYPTAVEGKKAVFDILKALKYFRLHQDRYDVIVIIRGGGSLESLQAFNNESLIREIATFPTPTLLGVGHEKDITLAALVGDKMVSTPTAAARELALTWVEGRQNIKSLSLRLPIIFEQNLQSKNFLLSKGTETLLVALRLIQRKNQLLEQSFLLQVSRIGEEVRQTQKTLTVAQSSLRESFLQMLNRVGKVVLALEEQLRVYDPKRALKLGYSLIKKGDRIIKESSGLEKGDMLTIQLGKGGFDAEVKEIHS